MNIKSKLKTIPFLYKIITTLKHIRKVHKDLNYIKTIYINLKTQKLSNAIKFPIFIYGKVTINSLTGKITITAPIKNGMIKLGYNSDCFSASKGCALININGELIFRSYCMFSVDYTIDVSGKCIIGDCVAFGNGVKLRCWQSIDIGDFCRIATEVQMFDTNFHYIKNIETGEVFNSMGEIIIGAYSWIGNRTTVMKKTILPSNSIVAGNSLLNKDYSKDAPIAPTLAGSPAKIIVSGNVRIFGLGEESIISNFFRQNPQAKSYHSTTGIKDEAEEVRKLFKTI